MDSCDLAFEENEREMSTMVTERGRVRLGQIDDALRRIASLKYGLFEMCGLDITAERLEAMPFARVCCDCQQERENGAKARRHREEQDEEGYKLSSIHTQDETDHDPLGSPRNESFLELRQPKSIHWE
jgi:RNA polymerase-binding transcription factor DksA